MPAYKDGRVVLGNITGNSADAFAAGKKDANYLVNIPQLMSQMNSKNHEHTDRDGHVKAFPFQLQVLAAAPGGVNLYVTEARNTWKFRNSFRKWHALRMHMFREAGITKSEMGTYGQTLRPYWDRYDQNMLAGGNTQQVYGYWSGTTASLQWNAQSNYLTPAPYVAATPATGEWTHSQFGTVPLFDNTLTTGGTAGLPIMDEWDVHIIGETVDDASASVGKTVTYTSVGMLHAYNLDRMEAMPDAISGTTIEGPNNPLAALAVSGNQAAGAILDIAEEQELDLPPYDTRDDGYSIDITATTTGVATTGTIDGRAVFNGMAAGGLFSFTVDADCYVTIDCQGEYLCKDY
jgi:hypothetical protein